MSYVTIAAAQQWLQHSKYNLPDGDPDAELEKLAVDTAFTLLARRYDTTTWINSGTTPPFVLTLVTMLYASYALRRATSEDDGAATYCDWLENRVLKLLQGLATGLIDIPGTDPDESAADVGVPEFWPTDESTGLWFQDPHAEGASARFFDMQKVF